MGNNIRNEFEALANGFGSFIGSIINGKNTTDSKEIKLFTWQTFLEKTSNEMDNRIITYAQKKGLIYIGGKCRFTVVADKNDPQLFIVNVDAELYYKDQFKTEENFVVYPLHKETQFSMFDMKDEETIQKLERLKTEQYEMMVEKPQY